MKKLLTALTAVVLLASCQKEVSFDSSTATNTNTNVNANGLLVKTVAVTGAETMTTLYAYDTAKRLSTITIDGVSGGMPMHSYQKFERDAAGRIVKVLQKLGDINGIPSDTAVKTIHYPNATSMEYDYSIHVMGMSMGAGLPSMQTIDSAVYHYTGGKLTSYDSYMSSSIMPGTIMSTSKWEFLFDAQNRVSGMKNYTDANNPGGPLDLMIEYKYTYGSTINGVYVSSNAAQNLLLGGMPNTGTDNIDKMVATSTNAQINIETTTTFVAAANGKATSGTAVIKTTGVQNSTQTTKYTFYYQ